jgi:alcohol dehydrogenase class IV
MRFEFMTATRIVFGAGAIHELGKAARDFGPRALIAAGGSPERALPAVQALADAGISAEIFTINGEPSIPVAAEGARMARDFGCAFVVGIGGGSALDAAKAIAALAANPGDPLDYLEVIGRALPLPNAPLPVVAIPTTAGTGSEVTRNAVLSSAEHRVKVSLRSPLMLPRLAIVDPELTYELPPDITASTGMDALTQVIEPFTSNAANPLTDALCREGITRAARSLRRAYSDGSSPDAREDMAITSLFGGLALANAKLGAVHGFAAPLGGMFDAPHGAICARLLPEVVEANIRALRQRAPQHLTRYDELARLLTGRVDATADDGAAWIRDLSRDLSIPPLAAYGIGASDVPAVVEKAAVASSMKGNIITLTADELSAILSASL